jgi:hypothetical protein
VGTRALLFALTLLLTVALVARLGSRGGPYFEWPATLMEHVGPGKHETRDALTLLPKIRDRVPRGATITCVRPIGAGVTDPDDMPDYLVAIGQLPHHRVVPPFFAMLTVPRRALPRFVVAVGPKFDHPYYHLVAEYPEGRLYELTP